LAKRGGSNPALRVLNSFTISAIQKRLEKRKKEGVSSPLVSSSVLRGEEREKRKEGRRRKRV